MRPLFEKFFSKNIYGAFLIVLGGLLTAGTNSLTHGLSHSFSSMQVLFCKCLIGVILFLVLTVRRLPQVLSTKILPLHGLKALFGAAGNGFWIWAVMVLPMAQSSALSLTSALFTSVGGWILFKEHFAWPLWVALLLGAVGVYVIVDPHHVVFSWYSLLPLASALCFSGSSLMIKRLSRQDSSETTLFYLLFLMMIVAAPFAAYSWQPVTLKDMLFFGGMGVTYLGTQLLLIEAYTHAAASFIAPFKFARFPLNIGAGMLFFGEWPPIATLTGGGLIIAAYFLLIVYDRKVSR